MSHAERVRQAFEIAELPQEAKLRESIDDMFSALKTLVELHNSI